MAVVEANAALMDAASRDAEEQAGTLQAAVASMATEPGKAREALSVARLSLSFARRAYQQAEPSVFYVNPDLWEELVAVPDPLQAGAAAPKARRLEQLAGSLDSLRALAGGRSSKRRRQLYSLWLSLHDDSSSLREQIAGLADSWESGTPSAFRQRFFLQSTDTAIARIFQGIIAITGDLLPNYWLREGGGWSYERPPLTEVAGRFRAVRNIYAGRAPAFGLSGGPGLVDLVREKSPVQADLTLQGLESSMRIADQLAFTPGDPASARAVLLGLSEQATRDLIRSAAALSIEIVEVPAAP